jgi:hypothetical protein
MVPVAVQVSATDDVDPGAACSISGVVNSDRRGVGADPDVAITGPLTVSLRARRFDDRARRYTISVRCTDVSGNVSTATTVVRVPLER